MRKIKFRGWHIESREMLNIQDLQITHGGKHIWVCAASPDHETEAPAGFVKGFEQTEAHFELTEYTGYKDIQGFEIYTDDILEIECNGKITFGVVIFSENRAAYAVKLVGYDDRIEFLPDTAKISLVISNKFENPELLEQLK